MGRPRIDLTGQKFNKLTVLKIDHINKKTKEASYLCKCDCGNLKIVKSAKLKNGDVKACGCLQGKIRKWKYSSKDYPKLYKKWNHMKDRCYKERDVNYKNYGARGITVCVEWRNSFDNFAEWSFKNGYKEELEIDRINNDGNYEPDNCRYVPTIINRRNKSTTQRYKYKGEMIPLAKIAEEENIKYKILWQRLNRDGKTLEEAINS